MKKITLVFILLFSAITLYSQDPVPYFSAVIVKNIESSAKWYTGVLKLTDLKRQENNEAGYKIVNLGNDHVLIELLELSGSISSKSLLDHHPEKKWINGIMKIGFKVHNIDLVFSEYKSSGISFRGDMITDPVSGKKSFIILDPDGNYLQFFES